MKERFEYYILNNHLFAYDTSSTFIVYWKDNDWHEECNMSINDFSKAKHISEKQALHKTKGHHPEAYIEELIEQEMLKNIYCP